MNGISSFIDWFGISRWVHSGANFWLNGLMKWVRNRANFSPKSEPVFISGNGKLIDRARDPSPNNFAKI